MLGIRQLYPSSAIHVACVLPLDDDLSHEAPSVLLAGVGFSVNVYHIGKQPPSSELRTTPNEEKCDHDVIAFTPTGHSINVGSMVIRMAALRHQLAIFLTRDLELIVVRYQANLPLNLNEKASISCNQCMSYQNHWCILYRYTSFTTPPGTETLMALGDPVADPQLIVGESGKTVQAIIFTNNVHTIHIEHLQCETTMTASRLTFFGLIGRSRSSSFYHSAWSGEVSAPSGEFRFRSHTKSESGFVHGESEGARAQRLHEAWLQGSPSIADEDLMLNHSIKVLAQKKHELDKIPPNSVVRDLRLPIVHISISFLAAKSLAALPSPGVPADCFIQLLANRSSIYIGCLNVEYDSPLSRPVVNTLTCLRVQPDNMGQLCSPYYVIAAPPNPWGKSRTCVYAFSSAPTGQYIHRWHVSKVTSNDFNVPQKGIRLTTSPERAVAGVFLFQKRRCSLWLLLEDGSLTEVFGRILEMLDWEGMQSQMRGTPPGIQEEGKFNDCLDGAWERCAISGLPCGFVPRSIQPLNLCGYTNFNSYTAVTQRYVLLMDYVCDAIVVDLQERCVVGGLLGEGAVTSVCQGPAHSMLVSHSKGTLTLLAPVVSAMIRTTKTLSVIGGISDREVTQKGTPLLKTAVQGLYPVWRVYADGELGEPLWGVLVCDANRTYLLSCDDHGGTEPFVLAEQRKQDGVPYWLDDEPTLYAAVICVTNGGRLALVQCTPTRLLVEQQTIDLPGRATHAAGCQTERVVGDVIRAAMLVAVILADSLLLFSCDSSVSPVAATLVHQQSQSWLCPPASLAVGELSEEEVVMLIGMWDGSMNVLHLKIAVGGALGQLTAVFHLAPPLFPSPISGLENCSQPSVPRNIVRMRCSGEAPMQWMILHDNNKLTVMRYDTGSKSKGASRPGWESAAAVMSFSEAPQGTSLSSVLKSSKDSSGFDFLLLQDEEIALLSAGAEGSEDGGLSALVRTVATVEGTPLGLPPDGWQKGFAVQTRSSATGLPQHTLFLTDGHQLVVASLPQLFRKGCCGSRSADAVGLGVARVQEGDGERERLLAVSPITYHPKRRVSITSSPSQRLTKTLYLSSLGLLVGILDCGETESSILVVVSETSLKVCDFLQLPRQVAVCAAEIPPASPQLEAFNATSQEMVLVGTAAVEGSLGGGRVLLLLTHPLRVAHTISVGEGAVVDLSVCRKASHCDDDPLSHRIEEGGAEILVAVCCGPLVCVYRLAGYTLYPLTSHRFEVDCTSVSLFQLFVSVGLGSLGEALLQLVYSQNASIVPDSVNNQGTEIALLLEGTLSYASSTTANSDSENEESINETRSETSRGVEDLGASGGESISTRLNTSSTPKLKVIAREPTLGAGVFKQGTYRGCSVRADDDGGVYISYFPLSGKSNLERRSLCVGTVGNCQTVMTHCWGLPSAVSAVKVEELLTVRAVEQRQPRHLHWCERSAVLLPASNEFKAAFLGCLDGSLFAAVELPYVFAFPLLRMEQIITDYYRNLETVSIYNDTAYASYPATSKYQPHSLYSPFLSKLRKMHRVTPGPSIQYTYESVPFVASCALRSGTREVVKKGAVCLDAVGEYFLLEKIVLGNVVRFEDLIPDAVERVRIEHKYHMLRDALINALQEEYGSEFSLTDCEEILNAW